MVADIFFRKILNLLNKNGSSKKCLDECLGYVILIKNILESINATDVLVEKINEWFSGNYRFTYVSIKDRLLQLNLIPAS